MVKVTVRLPEPVAQRLRERSRAEGRSMNDTAVRAIARGLGDLDGQGAEGWMDLGPLVEVPPIGPYDAARIRRLRGRLSPGATGIIDELDWVRGPH